MPDPTPTPETLEERISRLEATLERLEAKADEVRRLVEKLEGDQ